MFDAVLVANRGEIALRVLRACRELGVRGVAVYSEADRDAAHTRYADNAYLIGPTPASDSYLNQQRLLRAATEAGVDAIHPGYGFLAENADFAAAVRDAGFAFVGPPADAIRTMGDKVAARAAATSAGVPVVPGTDGPVTDEQAAVAFGREHGYPVAVKAAFGGGGRGMKVVRDEDELAEALEGARREAEASFGRGEVYLERYLERPRHVEIQVVGDLDGTVVHLGERDCSLQRRHQKLVEEAPAPGITAALRQRLGDAAVHIAHEVGYHNAGTCEFLLAEDGTTFYFLEMNTRLQVEHPVTELVTGIDLVHAQLRVAAGEGLGFGQDDVRLHGHAIEARINAEDPASGFMPTPGRVGRFTPPLGPWIRFDTAAEDGWEVPTAYDSMIGKLIAWGADRDLARRRMLCALDELRIEGIPTTAPFHRLALAHDMFAAGEHSTISVEHEWDLTDLPAQETSPAGGAHGSASRTVTVEVDGRRFEVAVYGDVDGNDDAPAPAPGRQSRANRRKPDQPAARRAGGGGGSAEEVIAPMQGTIVKYAVAAGDTVAAGDLVAVLEAMKMENHVNAHLDGTVASIAFEAGDVIEKGAVLARIEHG